MMTVMDFLILASAVPAWLFPIVYATRRWWTTKVGRSAMNLAVVIALVMVMAVVRHFDLVSVSVYLFMRYTLYGFLTVALWAHLFVLLSARRPAESESERVSS